MLTSVDTGKVDQNLLNNLLNLLLLLLRLNI